MLAQSKADRDTRLDSCRMAVAHADTTQLDLCALSGETIAYLLLIRQHRGGQMGRGASSKGNITSDSVAILSLGHKDMSISRPINATAPHQVGTRKQMEVMEYDVPSRKSQVASRQQKTSVHPQEPTLLLVAVKRVRDTLAGR